ncbi:MAG TPA: PilW family protein [Burkholderiales bacterium]|nr:PilW family protein [Burkholderiales bacterium]
MGKHWNNELQNARFMRGMSLPEILAAVLIGLIGMVVIMQVYATSEERKRTTTGTSDAQVNGNIAMFTMESAIRSAGFGMVTATSNMLGCNVLGYDSNRPAPDFNFLMAPVVISVGAAGAPDQITVIYGNSPNVVQGNQFVSGAASGGEFPLKNAAGVWMGDLVVAHEAGLNCSLAEVTGFLPAAINTVQHTTGATYSYVDATNTTITPTAKHNKGGGSGVNYSAGAMLYTLGRSPTVMTYQIGDDKLQTKTLIPYNPAQDVDADGTSDSDIGDGIVQLKALYGKDTDGDAVVDAWNATLPADDVEWMQVRAVRIALLARSAKFEKTAVTADCIAPNDPPNSPYWSGGCFTMADLADGTDWHFYRYRTYETVVPLRNMIWSN